jgi:hypothetical protein
MTKRKPQSPPLLMSTISGNTCKQLIRDLVRVLKDGQNIAPSETIEFVNAVIDYIGAIDESLGSSTDGIDDLIDARADYSGPGIIR